MASRDCLMAALFLFLRERENNGFFSVSMIALTLHRCHPAHVLQTLLQNRSLRRLGDGKECFQFGEGGVQSLPSTEPQSQGAWTADRTVPGNLCLGCWQGLPARSLGVKAFIFSRFAELIETILYIHTHETGPHLLFLHHPGRKNL